MATNTKVAEFNKLLKGKTIARIERFSDEELNEMQWYKNPCILVFTDNTWLALQSDDEGNDGGAGVYVDNKGTNHVLYVL